MLIWLIFAALTALCLIVVLRPLTLGRGDEAARNEFDVEIYRDQLKQLEREIANGVLDAEEAEAARLEISRRLLAAAPDAGPARGKATAPASSPRLAMIAVAVCLPAIALSLYLAVGSPQLPGQPFAARQADPADQQDMATLISKVEEHLRTSPDDARGWKIIVPAYLQQGRFQDAAAAYERIMKLEGRTPETLTEYGEALVRANQGLVTETARTAFLEAATQDKKQFKAVFYLGLAERQDGKTESAISLWQRLLDEGEKDAPWRATVESQIASARAALASARPLSEEELSAANSLSAQERDEMVEGMVARLAERLEENGKDLDGWLRLARSYAVLGRMDDARTTIEKAEANFEGDEASLKTLRDAKAGLGLVAQTEQPTAPALSQDQMNAAQDMTAEERQQMIDGMVARLADRLKQDGNDLDGWLRLARAYSVQGRTDDARNALDQAKANFAGNGTALARIEKARVNLKLAVADAQTSDPALPNLPKVKAPALNQDQMNAAQDMTADERREMIEGMLTRLASRLEENGKDLDGWLRLARSYSVLGKTDQAKAALESAEANFADDQDALSRIAQARDSFGLNNE